jgi:hypothetical protein
VRSLFLLSLKNVVDWRDVYATTRMICLNQLSGFVKVFVFKLLNELVMLGLLLEELVIL